MAVLYVVQLNTTWWTEAAWACIIMAISQSMGIIGGGGGGGERITGQNSEVCEWFPV